jgi:beta,beta-carotene 9',10'-dioxygenase
LRECDAEQIIVSYGAGFRSLTREIREPMALPVEGKLPSSLKGTLLRTGPAKFEVGSRTYNHWFDGLAMLHRFAFKDGGVTYANRFLKSKALCAGTDLFDCGECDAPYHPSPSWRPCRYRL